MTSKNNNLETIIIQSTFKLRLIENFLRKNSIYKFASDNIIGGWGSGYVCLPNWHPWYGKDYEELYDTEISVHGGLTYTDYDDIEDLWVIGFDTNHYSDDLLNCSLKFVTEETKRLEQQCLELVTVQRRLKIDKLLNR